MKRLFVLFDFYKQFIIASLIANIIIGTINPNYAAAIATKLFLTGFAWYFMTETTNKRKLTFYKNLGISTPLLFSFVFIADSFFTFIFIFLLIELK